MIHPNMATMLAFITTDLALPIDFFAEFRANIADSFNAITVDGDTSTNDTCIMLANGMSGIKYEDLSQRTGRIPRCFDARDAEPRQGHCPRR